MVRSKSTWKRAATAYLRGAFITGIPVWAILGASLVSAVFMAFAGTNPLIAYRALADGAFGSRYCVGITLVKATPLILAGLGAAFSFRAGIFNIGQEGQLYLGGLTATWLGVNFINLPPLLHIPLSLAGGFIAGTLWVLAPAILKARLGVNEIISTLLLNYVAIYLINFFVAGPMRGGETANYQSAPIVGSAALPYIIPGTRLHAGFPIALICALAVYVVLHRMPFGLQVQTVGFNPRAAQHAGIDVNRTIVVSMLISGGLAGLGGACEILGNQRVLMGDFSPGLGYSGIAAALLALNHPLGLTVTSVFLGALRSGGNQMQRVAGVPVTMVYILEGLTILFVIGGIAIRYLLRLRRTLGEV